VVSKGSPATGGTVGGPVRGALVVTRAQGRRGPRAVPPHLAATRAPLDLQVFLGKPATRGAKVPAKLQTTGASVLLRHHSPAFDTTIQTATPRRCAVERPRCRRGEFVPSADLAKWPLSVCSFSLLPLNTTARVCRCQLRRERRHPVVVTRMIWAWKAVVLGSGVAEQETVGGLGAGGGPSMG
jgi:hypothetical protein